MKIIAHRGNRFGSNPKNENKLNYILDSIESGFDCEVDIWYDNKKLYLGHDKPNEEIDESILFKLKNKLWIHCKNIDALQYFNFNNFHGYNYFWHQTDDYAITSKKYIWVYPGKKINIKQTCHAVCVMPESNNQSINGFWAICTDYAEKYNETNSF